MWLRLVQSARDKEEQNLEAYIKNGQLFYRSLRRIAKDEELLVWYGKELTELLLLYPSRSHKMNGRLACDLRVGPSLAGGEALRAAGTNPGSRAHLASLGHLKGQRQFLRFLSRMELGRKGKKKLGYIWVDKHTSPSQEEKLNQLVQYILSSGTQPRKIKWICYGDDG